ncbi:ATP-binding protein [Salisediminibacterium selenitireducens]|uniref:Anti-sigma regulatory factor, serine/threonine protein kinase n=1 Tax=Bacillus selenitireducens (strain ATCC 700615 / DSM 15326 / MLS10) TaxID=439292 RepID=D6Y0J9_BACIE|nr:ATP-binding protein [Salisediminibacterium selenitireducens]ADI00567.1 putative anti-sigma regulatory factor, serine/threonine protein kinase [[Bacillus] selenitireducens MLS10]
MILTDIELQTPEEFRMMMEGVRPKLIPYFDPVTLAMVDLAVTECLINAWEHGNRMDPEKHVFVSVTLTPKRLWVRIADEGPGFKPAIHHIACPDARKECGRGLYLMQEIMDDVKWNHHGNDFLLVKNLTWANATVQQTRKTPQETS